MYQSQLVELNNQSPHWITSVGEDSVDNRSMRLFDSIIQYFLCPFSSIVESRRCIPLMRVQFCARGFILPSSNSRTLRLHRSYNSANLLGSTITTHSSVAVAGSL